jgi:hypothetical protein
MTNRERAKAWMLERCPSELQGTRFGTDDVESNDTDTESGKPCDCLDTLTVLLDGVRRDALREASAKAAMSVELGPTVARTIAARILELT